MAKILYLSYDGMTDSLGQSQVLPYMSGLSALGYEIHILSFEKPLAFEKRKETVSKHIKERNLHWHPMLYTSRPPVLSTMMDVRKMKKKAKQLHREHGFHLVHVRSYIPALAALMLKQEFSLPFIFDMRGLWADERVDGGLWNLKNPLYKLIYRYFKKKEQVFLKEAARVISLTNAAIPVLKKISGNEHLSTEVIPCCVDTEHFDYKRFSEEEKSAARTQLDIGAEDFVLSYLGSLGTWYMLDEMLDFFAELKIRIPRSKFLFISHDDPLIILQKAHLKGISPEDIVVYSATRDEVPAMLRVSDANIFFIRPVFSKQASSPTKMAEVLAMGIPVVANSGVGDIEQQILENGVGSIVRDFNIAEYNRVIDELSLLQKISSEQCRGVALSLYNLADGIGKYADCYRKVLGAG